MTQSHNEDLMPGESNPDFARVVHEYLANFSYYKVRKEWALKEELYLWCRNNLGEQYKDWFVHEGGTRDKWWTVNVRSPKHGTLFALRWNDIIIESVDRRKR
jgi:hypothetical protein